ncbi:hypothetical protein [Spiroplasma endosymbiont of Panorpa germanica]|uniref:hypothetical protein n=1 Tax=Spiroplasma endosymbiont of Panorpa germanica TaxID=3066314 RepID=UPI0030D2EEF4
MSQKVNSGYQKFLQEKKDQQKQLLEKQTQIRSKQTSKPVKLTNQLTPQLVDLINKAKSKNTQNNTKIQAKLPDSFLKISIVKTTPKTTKKSQANDVAQLREKIANRTSKNYVFGNIISNYRKK